MEEIKTQQYKGVTGRAILIGLVLLAFNVYWLTITEMKYQAAVTALPLFVYPIFILFWLVVFNNGVLRLWPRIQFSTGELLTIYSMLVISTAIASYGMLQNLFVIILHPYQFTSPENEWKELFFHYIPSWFTVSTPDAVLDGYYRGDSSFYDPKHFEPWLRPMLVWTAFTLVLLFMLQCINTLVRRQWVQTERLAFPIIQLPVAMTQSPNFFRNGLLWIGFSIPFVLDLMNGLHVFFPAVPYLNLKQHHIAKVLTEKPWQAMSYTYVSFYPFMIGLSFFLPLDLSFSCWFFYLVRQFSRVFGSYIGLESFTGFPNLFDQAAGSWFAVGLIAIWVTRRHLVFAFRTAFSEKSSVDADEPMRYRTALLGLVGGFLFMFIFSYYAGMSTSGILVFFGLYFALSIGVTRVRAEFGTPHLLYHHPLHMMVTAFGALPWGGRSLTVMSFYQWFNRRSHSHVMPNQFEPLKMAEGARINAHRLVIAMMVGATLALIIGMWTNLDLMYREGALARLNPRRLWIGDAAWGRLETWMLHPTTENEPGTMYMGYAMALTVILHILRTRFIWWPLHPAGYAIGISFAIHYFWFTFFMTWVAKIIILRVGHVRGYQRSIPFFLGLILGDFVTGGLWMLYGVLTQQQTYMIYL